MRKEPAWLSVEAVLAIHDRLIADHGGQPGLRDLGLLESAIAAPRNHFASEQSDLFSLASSYANAISRDHPFHDGNKRLALTLAAVFLDLNGISLEADEHSAVVQIVAHAAGKLSMDDLARWLKANSRPVRRGLKRT